MFAYPLLYYGNYAVDLENPCTVVVMACTVFYAFFCFFNGGDPGTSWPFSTYFNEGWLLGFWNKFMQMDEKKRIENSPDAEHDWMKSVLAEMSLAEMLY